MTHTDLCGRSLVKSKLKLRPPDIKFYARSTSLWYSYVQQWRFILQFDL